MRKYNVAVTLTNGEKKNWELYGNTFEDILEAVKLRAFDVNDIAHVEADEIERAEMKMERYEYESAAAALAYMKVIHAEQFEIMKNGRTKKERLGAISNIRKEMIWNVYPSGVVKNAVILLKEKYAA